MTAKLHGLLVAWRVANSGALTAVRQRALHVGIDTLNAALAAVDHGLDAFTIHDLRRTMRTHLSSLGVRSEVAERCLNHKLPSLQAVYNTHDFFAERRAELETWTAMLLEIERGERKLAPMRSRRPNS
jgi:integrase